MDSQVLEKLVACPRLPTLPTVAMRVLELSRQHDIDITEIAGVIRNDPALAGKVLKTVNSSYYGLPRPCGTIRQAMIYLGVNTVRTLVLGFGLVQTLGEEDDAGFDYLAYWRRSVFSAVAGRELANRTHAADPEEVFLAALMQDIGMVAMERVFKDQYLQCINLTDGDHRRLPGCEARIFNVTHAEVGAELARRWKLPDQLIAGIQFHHEGQDAPPATARFARLVDLGGQMAMCLMAPNPDSLIPKLTRLASEWFDLNEKQVRRMLAMIADSAKETAELFKLETGPYPNVESILATAEEQLVEAQLSLERENSQLQQTNRALAAATLTDPLTGANNRKCFDVELDSEFDRARRTGMPLSVLFCDVDRFKSVNDTHGHQVGDLVLGHLARVLRDAVGEAGIVCRYGGEEFAVILPRADRVQATRIAESVRRAIESHHVDCASIAGAPTSLAITASIGVAAYETASAAIFMQPEILLRAADKAVYAAKAAGRNCVRVFTPPAVARAA